MLHTKIVDSKKEKILTSNAEKFIKDSKFGASIYFLNLDNPYGIVHHNYKKN